MLQTRVSAMLLQVAMLLASPVPAFAQATQSAAPAVSTEKALSAVVTRLASAEFQGRGAATRGPVTEYLALQFSEAGLQPSGTSFLLPFTAGEQTGVNVVGMLPGTDPELARRHLIVGAHWDHLGGAKDAYFPGAGDNASGVAALIAAARSMKDAKPRHTLVFIAFDLEEQGLLGSLAYAQEPALPLDRCDGAIVLDILGCKGLGLLDDYLFATGWEWTPEALDIAVPAAEERDLVLRCFGSDIPGDRSDFVAFRNAKVPYLFFSTGEFLDYHKPSDTADKLDYGLLARQAACIGDVLRGWDGVDERWEFRAQQQALPIEFLATADLCVDMLQAVGPLLPEPLQKQLLELEKWSRGVADEGEVAPAERQRLVQELQALTRQLR